MLTIYFDAFQEGIWFQGLSEEMSTAKLEPMPETDKAENSAVREVLAYDRPDAILVDNGKPILMVERTAEVPSGHNVGQRFARMAAAAQCRVPMVYVCPFAARKHGRATAGPRYVNLRLFKALVKLAEIEGTSVETVNWPVDDRYELILGAAKDERLRCYLKDFFELYRKGGVTQVNKMMRETTFHREQMEERLQFIKQKIKRANQYDGPPPSVQIDLTQKLKPLQGGTGAELLPHKETVLYQVGMEKIRSDPYTGMGMLYEYLYAGGASESSRDRNMVFWFPMITIGAWRAAGKRTRKDVRLFSKVADGILFKDGFLLKRDLVEKRRIRLT